MKVREFIKLERDIDVYDNVVEELGIAFCGPLELTEEGREHFAEVLDYDIEIHEGARHSFSSATLNIDFDDWKHRLRKAKEFFYSAAGYCADEDWNRWFIEEDSVPETENPAIMKILNEVRTMNSLRGYQATDEYYDELNDTIKYILANN